MKKVLNKKSRFFTVCIILFAYSQQVIAQQPRPVPSAYQPAAKVNYVRTWDAMAPEQDPNALMARPLQDAKQTTQYIDGLGRPLQTVIRQGSMATGSPASDIVSAVEYDELGREQFKYLPFTANSIGGYPTNDGRFKLNPFQQQAAFMTAQYSTQTETFFYGKINFESSPLNRVSDSYAPGNSWVGSESNNDPTLRRNVQMKYFLNTSNDSVKIWSVTNGSSIEQFGTYATTSSYPAGELYKNITLDENKKQVVEFKDKKGQVILKKVQLIANADDGNGAGYYGWLCTYYIYDDVNNLRCVIQPEGVKQLAIGNWQLNSTQLAEQCFRYEYDKRYHMIMKKVPGAGEVYMVYDLRDRIVMTQDANMRQGTIKWMVTKYDELNRRSETGLWTNNTSFSTHLSSASASTSYPSTSSSYERLTLTHYDDYAGLPGGLSATYLTTWNTNFSATSNSQWPYPQMPTQSNAVKGMATWNQVKVLGSSNTYLYSTTIYDDKGKSIQSQNTNITGGIDVVTTQYTWAGQPLVSVQKQDKQLSPAQTHTVITKMEYDDLGRVLKVKKTVNSVINNVTVNKAEQIIVQNEYDQLGQLKKKKIGNNNLENLTYDYNIRGWMLGANRDYAKDINSSNYFGFDLGYDKANNNIMGNQTYVTPQYNGNIEGMVWKSKGDGEKRKYDFTYDAANRLMKADFTQYTSGSFNQTALVNYDVKMGNGDPLNNNAYDANGNIKGMQQWGWKLAGSAQIDSLTYNYQNSRNRLAKVTDSYNDPTTKLGDFKDGNNGTTDDYTYDVNGNLNLDNNKAISSIAYNHLNLPATITVTGKGTIAYTYDAVGNKIKKVTLENPTTANNNKTITTTTTYLGAMVYESKSTAPANTPNDDYTDRLQFIGHEEGRIRFKPTSGSVADSFHYDYFLKDHLGNVRTVLTEQIQQDIYPTATMETATATTEETFYGNLPQTRIDIPSGYPPNTPSGNAKVAMVNGTYGGGSKIGPAMILKVMAGDKFNVKVNSWYRAAQPGEIPSPPNGIVTELFNALNNAVGSIQGGKATPSELNSSGVFFPGANAFLNNQSNNTNSSIPKAFLNWILFDEQFNYVSSNSGFEQVPPESYYNNGYTPNNNTKLHVRNDMPIDKNGYLYIYVSNETPNISVFFDNLQVVHTRGPILEETHYYPFGLVMSGISSKTAGNQENKYQFMGKEKQSKEFSDGSGLEWNDFGVRMFDPQIGRWNHIDAKAEKYMLLSPYSFTSNNPILFIDQDGKDIIPNSSFKSSSYYSVYQKLITSNKVYNSLLSAFQGNKENNYYLNSEEFNIDHRTAWAHTNIIGGTYRIKNGETSAVDIETYTVTENEKMSFKKEDGTSEIRELNDIGKALVLLHDGVHATIHQKFGNEFTDHGYEKDYMHENISRSYLTDIQNGLKEFNESEKLGYKDKDLENMSYIGLQNTKEFAEHFGLVGLDPEEYKKRAGAVIKVLTEMMYSNNKK